MATRRGLLSTAINRRRGGGSRLPILIVAAVVVVLSPVVFFFGRGLHVSSSIGSFFHSDFSHCFVVFQILLLFRAHSF